MKSKIQYLKLNFGDNWDKNFGRDFETHPTIISKSPAAQIKEFKQKQMK